MPLCTRKRTETISAIAHGIFTEILGLIARFGDVYLIALGPVDLSGRSCKEGR